MIQKSILHLTEWTADYIFISIRENYINNYNALFSETEKIVPQSLCTYRCEREWLQCNSWANECEFGCSGGSDPIGCMEFCRYIARNCEAQYKSCTGGCS
jgi:hypothetical protein